MAPLFQEPHVVTVADIGSTAPGLETEAFCPLPRCDFGTPTHYHAPTSTLRHARTRAAMMPSVADSHECLMTLLDSLPTLFTRDVEAQVLHNCQ